MHEHNFPREPNAAETGPENVKGKVYGSVEELYNEDFTLRTSNQDKLTFLKIYGLRIEREPSLGKKNNFNLMDDPHGCIEARPHKSSRHYYNLNFYENGELVGSMHLDNQNISQYRIEICQ